MFLQRIFWSYLVFLITLLVLQIDHGQGDRNVQFVNTNYTFSPTYFKNLSIVIENNTVDMEMELLKPITRGFKVHIDYQLRMANAKKYQSIFSRHVDVCAMVGNINDGLLKNWFKSMTKNSNFMHNCPVEVGHYYMRNWKMGSSMTHQFLHPGEYRSRVNFFYGKFQSKTEERVLSVTMISVINS